MQSVGRTHSGPLELHSINVLSWCFNISCVRRMLQYGCMIPVIQYYVCVICWGKLIAFRHTWRIFVFVLHISNRNTNSSSGISTSDTSSLDGCILRALYFLLHLVWRAAPPTRRGNLRVTTLLVRQSISSSRLYKDIEFPQCVGKEEKKCSTRRSSQHRFVPVKDESENHCRAK